MIAKKKILVTGASGFIGGWIVETLKLRGFQGVRAGIRSWSSAARLSRFQIEVVLCDVMSKEQLAQAMSGVTWVIHCAYGKSEVTVQGTENVLEAAMRVGVERVVHLSTTEVYGDVTGDVDEAFPLQRTGRQYGDAKIAAEQACEHYSKAGLAVTVIRPAIVYGPFGREWTVNTAQKLQSGNWGIFLGYGEGLCNLIYVSDLVDGILAAANSDRAIGEAFNLSGPQVVTWNRYFSLFNCAMGLPELECLDPRPLRAKASLMNDARRGAKFALAHCEKLLKAVSSKSLHMRALMKSAEQSLKTTPRPEDLTLYSRQARYVSTKAERLLGYRPRVALNDGLVMTVKWLEQVGLADRAWVDR